MAGFNPYSNKQNSFFNQNNPDLKKNPNFFNRLLRNLSNFGMNYDDMAATNAIGIGINEIPSPNMSVSGNAGITDHYMAFSQRAVSGFLAKKSLAFLDRAYPEKKNILSEYAVKQEIREFVQILCNEAIVYDNKNQFARAQDLPEAFTEDIKKRIHTVFDILYSRFKFNDGRTAWNHFKQFIVTGYLAFEIVYDDKQKNIIGLNELDPFSLTFTYDPFAKRIVWIQNPEDPYNRRIFLDVQIIYLSYSSINSIAETSYVEGLIRPYNLYRIIEETRVMYNITNAAPYKKFIIPTEGLSRQQAQQAIAQLMAAYEDKMYFDSNSGIVYNNGEANIPYNKEVWLPQTGQGTPTFEYVNNEGPNLNEVDVIRHFSDSLKRASMIPFTRLDKETGGGNMYTNAAEVSRDELNFTRFVGSLRAAFNEILIKPLWIQMCLEHPELASDENFKANVNIKYNQDNLFEEWKILTNLDQRANIINNLYNLKVGEDSYFDMDFLVKKWLGLNDADLEENRSMKSKSLANKPAAPESTESGF